MKKIEDYLHLYLGCDVNVTGEGKYNGVYTLEKIITCGFGVIITKPPMKVSFKMQHDKHKLILRPLSDMTEEELRIVLNFMETHFSKDSKLYSRIRERVEFTSKEIWAQWYCIKENGEKDIVANLSHDIDGLSIFGGNNYYRCYLKTIPFLISKGFDLFGLIESGLAIDKTTLEPSQKIG
jgi:hypothetical protein